MRIMSLLGIVVASLFVSSVRGDAPATLFNRIVYAAGTTYTVNVATNGNVTLGPAKTYGAVAYVLFPDFTYVQLYRLDWDLAQNSGGWAATDVGAWEYVRANQFAGVLRLRPTGAAIIEHSLSFETDRSGAINSPARSGQIFAFWLGDRASFGPVVNAPPLVNASLRAEVNPSGQAIAGFVVSGKSPRAVLVRAVGPGLALFGVTSPLADPKLNVPALTTPLTRNDNWAPFRSSGDYCHGFIYSVKKLSSQCRNLLFVNLFRPETALNGLRENSHRITG